ncbi:MAG: TrkH family potassium uptake protein [Clostridia bacterium]|nr:TrkH family potassium uptake protein [Oscillospiraceae bacterium]MBQ7032855.1 TrkH family potassium uptake protein [Clostridia bacterium]
MNYKMIAYLLGWVLKIEAVTMALPLICAILYGEQRMVGVFVSCIIICLFTGLFFSFRRPSRRSFYAKEGFVTVGLSWIAISLFGALPFVFSGFVPNFVDALFETISGFTTTGSSILTDVEALPKSLLFWRSFTHWIGGMGVLVFLVAIIPSSGGGNMHLIRAESPGPAVSKLVPKVRSTAAILYKIYIFLTLVQIGLLLAGGMPVFDAITMTFGTAGTGGFGVLNASAANYSPYCQWVITVFMLIFGVDFSLYYLLLLRRGKDVLKSAELRTYILLVITAIGFITWNCIGMYKTFGETLRHGAFQVASIITTTGFATTNFDIWPVFSKTILVLLMFVGACAGSTGGGIKVSRVLILMKSIVKEIKTAAHPRNTMKITMNGRIVAHETVRAVNVYMASYLLIFALSLLIISLDNFDFTTNFTSVAATINNVGPGLAAVGPTRNFFDFSALSKLVLSFNMLVGRLEIFPILILFSPSTWKK